MNGEDPQERPEQIRNIINGLERYNPQAADILEAYLTQQCEEKFTDCASNRALLKLYVLILLFQAQSQLVLYDESFLYA